MKKHLMTAVCILLAAACVCLSAALVLTARDDAQAMGTTPGLANASSDDIQFKLALLHLYKEATDVTLVLPYTTVNLTQTAVTRAFIGSEEGEIAIREMNERVDRTLNSAFDTMTDITDKYAAVLKDYSLRNAGPTRPSWYGAEEYFRVACGITATSWLRARARYQPDERRL